MALREEPFAVLSNMALQIQRVLPTETVREGIAGITGEVEAVRDMLILEGRKAESQVFDSLRGGLLAMDAAIADVRKDMLSGGDRLMEMAARLRPPVP